VLVAITAAGALFSVPLTLLDLEEIEKQELHSCILKMKVEREEEVTAVAWLSRQGLVGGVGK
jgi:hypothetical protein